MKTEGPSGGRPFENRLQSGFRKGNKKPAGRLLCGLSNKLFNNMVKKVLLVIDDLHGFEPVDSSVRFRALCDLHLYFLPCFGAFP